MPNPIDLSIVPAPDIVETLSFEVILAAMLTDLRARDSAFSALVESDPAYKILEVAAYRELLIRQRVNDSGRQVMLAHATGTNLDNLAALFAVTRKQLTAGNLSALPPVPATYETDTDFRYRVQLSLDSFSTAGPVNAYKYWALSHPAIKDVAVYSLTPGVVSVYLLGNTGSGALTGLEIGDVYQILNSDDIRPLTDQLSVSQAAIMTYTISASIYTAPGPDPAVVLASVQAALTAFAAAHHKIGDAVFVGSLYAAIYQPGVYKAISVSPGIDQVVVENRAYYCTSITVTNLGVWTL